MSFEETIETIVRKVVREELRGGTVRAAEPEPDLVKLGEVRRYIAVSASTLKKWIRGGELAKYGKGRVTLVRLDEVRAVLKQRAASTAPAEPGGERATAIVASLAARRAAR